MFSDLTTRQQRMLRYIADFYHREGYSPSFRDIQKALDLGSTSTVSSDVHQLIQAGFLEMAAGSKRSIRLAENRLSEFLPPAEEASTTPYREDVLDIPVFGNVAAGSPVYADEVMEQTIPLPTEFFRIGYEYFVLHISGDSMIEAGIFNGDYVIIKRQNTARNGDQVVALIDDSATVKTFYQRDGYIELRPENSAMRPIRVRHCEILGVVAGLYRIY